jgi:hypothetical protein
MGEGLFKGVLHAGKEWEWWQLGAPATWSTSGSLERWMHRLANKSTSEPHGILCEFGCNQESVAASTLAKLGSRRPRPDTGSAPGSARKQNSVSYGLVLRTFPE